MSENNGNKKDLKAPTIKDIAKAAGVSISTVSYVLNNTKNVSDETKEKVHQAIEELQYHPRAAARALKSKRSQTIGIIVPEISNFFFTEIIRGVEDIAYSNGYNVILCCTNENPEKEERYFSDLVGKDIDGLIFVGTGQNQRLLEKARTLPTVVVDRKLDGSAGIVISDNQYGGELATNYLLEKYGYPIHYLSGPTSLSSYFDRLSGHIKALNAKGYDFNEAFIHPCVPTMKGGYEAIKRLLKEGHELRSVFASADMMALGAIRAFYECGLAVGKDVFLVGFDDVEAASMVTPSLTTVNQQKYEMGYKAGQLLLKKINNIDSPTKKITLMPTLVVRETA